MELSGISEPNFTTFDHGVLLAAIDSHDRIIKERCKNNRLSRFSALPQNIIVMTFILTNTFLTNSKRSALLALFKNKGHSEFGREIRVLLAICNNRILK